MATGGQPADYSCNQERTNYARLCRIIIDLCTQVLRDVLSRQIPANQISQKAKQCTRLRLNPSQRGILGTAVSCDYKEFDISLLYALIRNLCPGINPTNGWSPPFSPTPAEITEGDDVERIHFIRNKVYGHMYDTCISDSQFKQYLQILQGVMSRMDSLLGGNYSQILSVIETDKMNDEDVQKHFIDLIKELQLSERNLLSEIESIQGKTDKMNEDVQKQFMDLTKEQKLSERHLLSEIESIQDPVPKNKRGQYQSMIEEWEKEDVLFYETRGMKSVKDAIKKHNVVTVTANMGAGKTATIHHLALELKKDGYDILQVRTPKEIDKYIQKNQKQIFILDDPVGVHSLDRQKCMKWVEFDSILKPFLRDGNTKILCSIRKQVINESDFKILNCLLNKNIIDIEDEENRLTDDEKLSMIKLHLEVQNVGLKLTQEAHNIFKNMQELFPLSCQIFCSSEVFQGIGWKFFSNPFRLVLDDLKKMQISDKVKYFVLVLCFAYENSLDSNIFNSLSNKKMRHKGEPYMASCGVNNDLLLSSFSDNAESLIGVYLKKEGRFYKFIHGLIHDVVTFSVGKKFPGDVIKFSSSKFICDRIIVSDETAPKDDPYVIILPSDSEHLSDLAERLIADLEKGIHNHVMMNKCMNDVNFMKLFIEIFQKKRRNFIYRFFSKKSDIMEIFIMNQHTLMDVDDDKREETRESSLDIGLGDFRTFDMLNFQGTGVMNYVVMFALRNLLYYILKNLHFKIQKYLKRTDFSIESHQRYRDEIKHEIKVIAESGSVNTWSWYYKAMQVLSIEGITALHWVVTFGHRTLFKYIWENLSSYQKKQVIKKVPLLHYACLGGDIEICKVLLEVGSNKINTYTATLFDLPLHYAAEKSADVVQLLIDHGVDVNAKTSDSRGRTAIYYAAGIGNVDIVNVLIHHGADVNLGENDGWSPLMIAAQNNHVNVAKLLLEHKADVNLCYNKGWSPLMYAAHNNHVIVAKLLLEYKADVNLCSNQGWSPLMYAAQNNHVNVAKLLLEYKADVNLCENDGWSPLMIAAQNNHVNVAELLLKYSASVDLCDDDGKSALMLASDRAHAENDCDVTLCNNRGETALMIAQRKNSTEVISLLQSYKPPTD